MTEITQNFLPTSSDEDEEPTGYVPTAINYGPQAVGAVTDPTVLERRASLYEFATVDADPTLNREYYKHVLGSAGAEQEIRRQEVQRNQYREEEFRYNLIQDMSKKAGEKGIAFSEEEKEIIRGLSSEEIKKVKRNPQAFFETEYARKLISRGLVNYGDPDNEEGSTDETTLNDDPGIAKSLENQAARHEIARKIAEDADQAYKGMSWPTTFGQYGMTTLPGYTWYVLNRRLEENYDTGNLLPWLAGSNLEEKFRQLWTEEPDKFAELANRAYTELAEQNTVLARDWAQALNSYSSNQAILDNVLIGGADVLSFAPGVGTLRGAARSIRQGASKVNDVRRAYKRIAANVSSPDASASAKADALGDTELATGLIAAERIKRAIRTSGQSTSTWKEMTDVLPTIFNPEAILSGVTNLSKEAGRRVADAMLFRADATITNLLLDPLANGARISEEGLRIAVQETREKLARELKFSDAHDSILDVTTTVPEDSLGVTNAIISIGKADGTRYTTAAEAHNHAKYLHQLPQFTVARDGDSYIIQVTKPIDLTSPNVRNQLIQEVQSEVRPLSNIIGRFLTGVRSGEDVLPQATKEMMKISTFGGSKAAHFLMELTRDISIKNNKDFLAVIKNHQIKEVDEATTGYFSNTIVDLEKEWLSITGKMPSEQEVKAYFAYKQLSDTHYLVNNYGIYTEKLESGHQNFRWSNSGDGEYEGVLATALPTRSDDSARVLVLDDGNGAYLYNSAAPATRGRDSRRAQELLDNEGYSIIKLSPTGMRQLQESGRYAEILNEGVTNYVVVKDFRTTMIPVQQTPYVAGGRHIVQEGHYVTIPSVRLDNNSKSLTFFGDNNLFHIANKKDGEELVRRFNVARTMVMDALGPPNLIDRRGRIRAGATNARRVSLEEARNYVRDNLPVNWREFRNMYYGRTARYDVRTPIMLRGHDQSSATANKFNSLIARAYNRKDNLELRKFTESQHNTYKGRVNLQFAQERGHGIRGTVVEGTSDAPVFKATPAPDILDPMAAINRTLNSVAQGRNFNAMKMTAGERFIAEFGDLLVDGRDALMQDPVHNMLRAEFRTDLRKDELERLALAKAYRGRMIQFMGLKTEEEKQWEWLVQKMIGAENPDIATGLSKSMYEILVKGSPVQKIKEIAFTTKLGLFNPKQLVMQGMAWGHIIGLAGPVRGTRAGASAMLQNILFRSGDNSLDDASAALYKSLGWGSKEEFLEATTALRRSGFDVVGREVATREQHLNADIVQTGVGRLLDHGLYFFKQGEAFARRTAWNAAYMEWRAANPNKGLTDLDISKIIDRADLFNVNMTQASNASWQKGAFSIPTQFWAYQVRLTEQLLGKRLSNSEKARLLTTYSMLYGVPVTASASVIWPVHENIKEWLVSKQIDVDDNIVSKIAGEGLFDTAFSGLMGVDLNVNETFGPSGLPFLREFVNGEKNVVEAMIGASGNVFADIVTDIYPGIKWLMTDSSKRQQPQISDFTEVIKNVSTANNLTKTYMLLAYQKHMTKYGETIDTVGDQSALSTTIMAMLGLRPDRIEDMYVLMSNQKARREAQSDLRRKGQNELRLMAEAISKGDDKTADMHRRRADIYFNDTVFTPQEIVDAHRQFIRENGSLTERVLTREIRDKDSHDFVRKLQEKWRVEKGEQQ